MARNPAPPSRSQEICSGTAFVRRANKDKPVTIDRAGRYVGAQEGLNKRFIIQIQPKIGSIGK